MSSRSDKMYNNSPRIETNAEGKKAITKADKKTAKVDDGTAGEKETDSSAVPDSARHAMERMQMHAKHEQEHHTHDHGKGGDKSAVHSRHQDEIKAMHKKHQKEMSGGKSKSGSTGSEKIQKVEKDNKE